jgi:hypothetical protein
MITRNFKNQASDLQSEESSQYSVHEVYKNDFEKMEMRAKAKAGMKD